MKNKACVTPNPIVTVENECNGDGLFIKCHNLVRRPDQSSSDRPNSIESNQALPCWTWGFSFHHFDLPSSICSANFQFSTYYRSCWNLILNDDPGTGSTMSSILYYSLYRKCNELVFTWHFHMTANTVRMGYCLFNCMYSNRPAINSCESHTEHD